MIFYTQERLEQYLKDDIILRKIMQYEDNEDLHFRTHQWLKEIVAKRMIFKDLYGDLLIGEPTKSEVLDVGGGYTSLTKQLVLMTNYKLLDYMAHGEDIRLRKIEKKLGRDFWLNIDWYDFEVETPFDIIIANDIFPDVDQRLEIFLDKFLPICREIRLLITFYNFPCFYTTKRIDDTELLTFLSWDGEITLLKLKKYADRIVGEGLEKQECFGSHSSVFKNGRQCMSVTIKGDIE